jgi:hypothetical protein
MLQTLLPDPIAKRQARDLAAREAAEVVHTAMDRKRRQERLERSFGKRSDR